MEEERPPNGPHRNMTAHQCWHPAVFFLFSSKLRSMDARLQWSALTGLMCALYMRGAWRFRSGGVLDLHVHSRLENNPQLTFA